MEERFAAARARFGPPIDPARLRVPRALAMAILGLLLIEFIVGMATALWTTNIPSSLQPLFSSSAGNYGWLSVHVLVALVLVVAAIALVALLARIGRRRLLGASIGGLLWILLAAASGAAFVDTGQNAAYSLLMALFFLGAWTTYLFLSMRLRRASWLFSRPLGEAHVPPGAPGPSP